MQIENKDFRELINKHNNPETFIYVDAPYELKKRNYKKTYSHEFKDQDHLDLADHLNNSKSLIMISHSKSELYENLYDKWNYIQLPPKGHSQKNKKQEECIWINYPLSRTKYAQLDLFKKF